MVLAGVALGLTAERVGFGWGDPRHWIPDLAVGWILIGCGLIASRRRPESRTGPLLAATGFTWFVGNFAQVGVAEVAWARRAWGTCIAGPWCSWCSPTRPGARRRDGSEAPSRSAIRWR